MLVKVVIGYAGARITGNYRVADGGANGDLITSSGRLRNHMNFSSLGMLSRITEAEHENGRLNGMEDPKVENVSCDNLFSTFGSWNNDSSYYAENLISGIKREMDDDRTLFVNTQDVETENRAHILSRHLSLPKAPPAEIGAMEKLLHFQDTVPCKIRAKRGCATHPRSIAERQTNTSDMLDLAVEYIKGLQKQYKV
ncbi:transcription factor bhlh130 [Phtheirospermum japonicum]|uniref:Transcription factor bhlh130 n=1 Tax=Phtheirospermum japonicum TaxID=374723 RepID=A0A830BU66_9LAMI|nr:transcription factor bhlh130 [Phtheirospermum japonicum]